jgi:type IV pilus assembly protein PilE
MQTTQQRTDRGFTLIEIMIVLLIIAILAGVAIPAYNDFIIRGAIVEAHQGLGGYRIQMEQYYQDNRTYDNGGACGVAQPTYKNFTQTCRTNNGGQGYLATATGTGRATGFTFTIDSQNNRQTTAGPTGWLSATQNCFIVRKNSCT